MSLLVVGLGIALLSVPALAASSRIGPALRVRAACVSAIAGIWILGAGAALTALPLVMVWRHGAETTWYQFTHLSPGGPVAWSASGVLSGIGVTWIVATVSQAVRTRRRAALPRWAVESAGHNELAGAEVRIAPSARPVAFAVPGRDRHVLISRAVQTMLTEPELRAVLAHEGAHLRLRHDRHLLILATYERLWSWLPGVKAVVSHHRHAIEQWADVAASDQSIELDELRAARRRLTAGPQGLPSITLLSPGDTSLLHAGRLVAAGAALMAAGAYLTTHLVTDLAAVIAVLH